MQFILPVGSEFEARPRVWFLKVGNGHNTTEMGLDSGICGMTITPCKDLHRADHTIIKVPALQPQNKNEVGLLNRSKLNHFKEAKASKSLLRLL